MSQQLELPPLGFFVTQLSPSCGSSLGRLFVVKAHLFFQKFLFLFGKLIVSQKLVVAGCLFSHEFGFFPELVDLKLHALSVVVVVESVPLLVVVFARQQTAVVFEFVKKAVLLVVEDFDLFPELRPLSFVILQVLQNAIVGIGDNVLLALVVI